MNASGIWGFVRKHWAWIVLLAVLALTSVVRVRLLDVPLERDEGEYAYTAQLLLDGQAPFEGAYSLKLPGTAYMYAASFLAFGESVVAIRLGLLLINVATVLLIFGIGTKLGGKLVGTVAGAAYALSSLSIAVLGFTANTEHYAVLFMCAGTLVLLQYRDQLSARRALAAGLLFGLAVLMKQHAAVVALWAGCWLLWFARTRHRLGTVALHATSFGGAVLVPLALLTLYAWSQETLHTMLFWTWDYARAYASIMPWSRALESLLIGGAGVFMMLGGVLVLAGMGIAAARRSSESRWWFAVSFMLASALALSVGFYYRGHYFILALPAVAVLAGLGVRAIHQFLQERHGILGALVGTGVVCSLALAWIPAREVRSWFTYTVPDFSRHAFPLEHFVDYRRIAEDVSSIAVPGSRIAVFGSEPEVYFYTKLRSATSYLYTYPFLEQQPFQERMFQEYTQQLLDAPPDYVVVIADYYSWGAIPWEQNHTTWSWLASYLEAYEPVFTQDFPKRENIPLAWQKLLPEREWCALYRYTQ